VGKKEIMMNLAISMAGPYAPVGFAFLSFAQNGQDASGMPPASREVFFIIAIPR
jgi:hypothetical protein